jgi:hypothetical protein
VSLSYAHVVRSLGSARDRVLGRFRELGGDREAWRAKDREAMARSLTAAEDEMELEASRSAEKMATRSELRRVRRVLECEVGS